MAYFTNGWYALICTALIICTLIEFLIPPGKLGKFSHIILSSFMLCAILNSVISLKKFEKPSLPNVASVYSEKHQNKFTESVNRQVDNLMENSLKAIISEVLVDFKIKPKKIEIFTDKNTDNCIVMIKCKIYIDAKDQEFAESAKNKIEKKLNIATEFVEI